MSEKFIAPNNFIIPEKRVDLTKLPTPHLGQEILVRVKH